MINHDADHQPERKQRVHQGLSPFRFLFAEMTVDMQRLRIERHIREQHVVHLSDGAGERMLIEAAHDEIFEINASPLVTHNRLIAHPPSPLRARACFAEIEPAGPPLPAGERSEWAPRAHSARGGYDS